MIFFTGFEPWPEWLSWLNSPFGAALIMGIAYCGGDLLRMFIRKNK